MSSDYDALPCENFGGSVFAVSLVDKAIHPAEVFEEMNEVPSYDVQLSIHRP